VEVVLVEELVVFDFALGLVISKGHFRPLGCFELKGHEKPNRFLVVVLNGHDGALGSIF
jgi:hypothetical protein